MQLSKAPFYQLIKNATVTAAFMAVSSLALAEQHVMMKTSQGDITIELFEEEAPLTVHNFLNYVKDGFYSGTQFHRVISGFMIQGGGFTVDMERKQTQAPVKNESTNGVNNKRGTIAMARTRDPDSATAQFFINVVDNLNLDAMGPRPGYTVFGRVVEGMEVVDKIAATKTTTKSSYRDVPVKPIIIESLEITSE
ncbi:peptidylprolyl isomerase [Neptunomonas phycophila]|uniref:peptidylprolyl isomerase n=1 Tax=Neptunomonas phycophila TaxID=1572645 RepID=UPI003BAA4332